jgi:hypothetical protein
MPGDIDHDTERDEHIEASGVEDVPWTHNGRLDQPGGHEDREENRLGSPTMADANSQRSSETNTTDPNVRPSRPRAALPSPCARPLAAALHKRLVKSPLARLR